MIFNYTQQPASSGGSDKIIKGFQPTAFNSDGCPTAGTMYGTWSKIPAYYFYTNVASGGSGDSKSGEGYFKDLSSLTFDKQNTTNEIGGHAFMGLTKYPINTVPNASTSGLLIIGSYAFANCTLIVNFTFPGNTGQIGSYVFNGCANIKKIYFDGTPNTINSLAFQGLSNVDIYVPWAQGAVSGEGTSSLWGATNSRIHRP